MGKFATALATLPQSDFDVKEAAALLHRTMDALKGSCELPITRIRIPTGGAQAFELPGYTPDTPRYENALEGVILASRFVNAYWSAPFGEGESVPLCVSQDGISGWDTQGLEHNCIACPRNRMGSRDGGRGKACRNMVQLMLLVEGEPMPVEMRIPPMSLSNYQAYIARQLSPRGLEPWQVVTRLSLSKASNSGGVAYAQVNFQALGLVDEKEVLGIREKPALQLMGEVEHKGDS